MYLKKVDGPRAVTLPDGKVFSRADLPPPDTARWVASRKLAVDLHSKEATIARYWNLMERHPIQVTPQPMY